MHVSNSNNNNLNNNKVYLTNVQTDKLKHVLDRSIPIYSSSPSTFPTLNLTPRHFLRQVFCKLKEYAIDISSVCLNGGAASYVLVNDPTFLYRDIDILIHIRTPLSSEQKTTLFSSNNQSYLCDVWTIIKYIICSCLLEHITNATSSTEQTSPQYTHNYLSNVLDTYARKNIKISSEQDSWALLSLQNYSGQNLELKFVEHLKRQWQFSVDSFQINLEPLLFETKSYPSQTCHRHICKCPSISSITKTIKTKNLVIDAINGLTIIKKECHDIAATTDIDDDNHHVTEGKEDSDNSHEKNLLNPSSSPLQFGFFTPSSSPKIIDQENNIECQTLATITTISTSNIHHNRKCIYSSQKKTRTHTDTTTLNQSIAEHLNRA